MAQYTPNYNLKKPEQEDFYNVDDFNGNMDILDGKLIEIETALQYGATLPTTGEEGDIFFLLVE